MILKIAMMGIVAAVLFQIGWAADFTKRTDLKKWPGVTLAQAGPDDSSASSNLDNEMKMDAAIPESTNENIQTPESIAPAAPSQSDAPTTAPASPQPAAAPAAAPAATTSTPPQETAPSAAPSEEKSKEQVPEEKKESGEQQAAEATRLSWEISAHSVTVDGLQWTRLTVSPDIPIWKFGLGLDIECFIDQKGNFSEKGWEFDKNNWKTSLARKLKYIRFGHENDPFFAKVGGLSKVTLGYGFIVDRFTNLLHYPDQKLLGVQLYLNNLGPIGVTLQTMTPDVMEFNDKGGIFGGRLAVCPLKSMNLPLLSALSVGATYAMDINEYAPARSWKWGGNLLDKNDNHRYDLDVAYRDARNANDSSVVRQAAQKGWIDTTGTMYPPLDTTYRDSTRRYAILGGDIGMPVLKGDLVGIDIYGQAGVVADSNMLSGKRAGWGFGAPGVRLTAGLFTAQIEYRHIHGRFTPGYFSPYYLDERLMRYPKPAIKSDSLPYVDLDGIFGTAGVNIYNFISATGSYQIMMGSQETMDQRFEASGGIGDAILKRIPKVNKAEMYFYKTNINRTIVVYNTRGRPLVDKESGKPIYDEFFEQTPTLFWGYRIGVEIAPGASLLWDTRYGYQWNSSYRLVPYNNISIGTIITF